MATLCLSQAFAKEATLLILGDSLSTAYQMPQKAGWVSLLEHKIHNEISQNAKVINASIVGNTTGGGLRQLPRLLEIHQPTLVFIQLGGNDGLRGFPIARIQDNLSKMITLCKAKNTPVLLAGIYMPPNYGKSYTDAFAKMFARLSETYEVPLIPFLLQDIALNPDLMLADGIHPTAAAQPIILQNVWPTLKNQLLDKQ